MLLIEAGHEVFILDNLSNSKPEVLNRIERIAGKRPEFYQADIRDKAALDKIIGEVKPQSVIHFAGLKAVGESIQKPLEYYENNVTGTFNLLEAMKKHNVKNIVFSSSATVYGDPHTVPIKEDFPLSATNPYGQTKLTIEYILKDLYKSDPSMNIAILRYFNPIGAHESGNIGEDPSGIPNNLLPYVAQVAIGKLKELSVFGNDYKTHDGTGVRDYIHVVDLARGHLAALNLFNATHNAERITQNGGLFIYNLGTGKGYSVLDIVKAFEKASGVKVPYKIVARRAGDIAECYADPTKAAKELNWKAEYDLERMCADSWRWQSKNPNGY